MGYWKSETNANRPKPPSAKRKSTGRKASIVDLEALRAASHTEPFDALKNDVVVRCGAAVKFKFAASCMSVLDISAHLKSGSDLEIDVQVQLDSERNDDGSRWRIETCSDEGVDAVLHVPVHAPPGRFKVQFDVQQETSSCIVKLDKYLVIVLDPYSKESDLYMPAELMSSYLEPDHGVILMGTANAVFTRGWIFAQYTKAVLSLTTSVLEHLPTALTSEKFVATVLLALFKKIKDWRHYPHVLGSHNWVLLKQGGEKGKCEVELPSWLECALASSVLRFLGVGCRIVTAYNSVHPTTEVKPVIRHFHLPCLRLDRSNGVIQPFTCWNEIWIHNEWHVYINGDLVRVSSLRESPEMHFAAAPQRIEYLFDVSQESFDSQKIYPTVLTTSPRRYRSKIEDLTQTYTDIAKEEDVETDSDFAFDWKLSGLQRFGQELHMTAQVQQHRNLLEEPYSVKYLINVACFHERTQSFRIIKIFSGSSSIGLEIRRILHRIEYERCLGMRSPTLECTCLTQVFNSDREIIKTFCRTQLISPPFYEPKIKRLTPTIPSGELLKVHVTFRNCSTRVWKNTRLVYTFSGDWEYNKIQSAVCCTHRCGRLRPGETRSTTLLCRYPKRRMHGNEALVMNLVGEGLKHAHRTFYFKVESPRV